MFLRCFFLLTVLGLFALSPVAEAGEFPRLASLKDDTVYVRAGPGKRYPILWVFNRKGWPVTLIAEFENWYKIRDLEGEEGWIYRGIISGRVTGVVTEGEHADVYRTADMKQNQLFARLEGGVVVEVDECNAVMCAVEVGRQSGWMMRDRLLPQSLDE